MIALISRMTVQSANAMCGQHFVSTAPIFQAAMFAHALGRALRVQPSAVALVHHDAQLLGESFYGNFQPQQRRGSVLIDATDYSSKNRHALSLQPTASAHLKVSVLMQFDEPIDPAEIEQYVRTARFNSGQIIDTEGVHTFDADAEATKAIRSGYWIIERADLMSSSDPVASMLAALAKRPVKTQARTSRQTSVAAEEVLPESTTEADHLPDEDELLSVDEMFVLPVVSDGEEARTPGNSWLSPAVLGYATITSFAHRPGARGGYPHAFAEPLVGLVQFVSIRHHETSIPWWSCCWLTDDVFVVRQHVR